MISITERIFSPNACALFVEPPYRGRGIARRLFNFIKQDMAQKGIERLYLVTDHTAFYEKCGWEFFTMVHDGEGIPERMVTTSIQEGKR